MWIAIGNFIMYILSTDAAKTLIAMGINKLLESSKDGITRDLAVVMIESVAKSQMNPTKEDMFSEVLEILNRDDDKEPSEETKEVK